MHSYTNVHVHDVCAAGEQVIVSNHQALEVSLKVQIHTHGLQK